MLTKQSWMKCADDIMFEVLQCKDEGKNTDGLHDEASAIKAMPGDSPEREEKGRAFFIKTGNLPISDSYGYTEPDGLDEILANSYQVRNGKNSNSYLVRNEKSSSLYEKILGGWLGRSAGCLLGQPVECWRKDRLVGLLKETGNYPVNYYISSDISPELRTKYGITDSGHVYGSDKINWINNVEYMPEDDDTNYTIIALKIVETYGRGFTADDVAECWLANLPILHTCTAERVAYRNLCNLMMPPQSAMYCNPYREWIGAQIRADLFGYINPGDPKTAAIMAYKDASISHVKNGIYGEMFVAAMIAAAFAESYPAAIVRIGMDFIPHTSRLYKYIQDVLDKKKDGMTVEQMIRYIHGQFDENNPHDWCHTISNAMIVVSGLLYGEGDFEKSIGIAVEAAFDTDCNGATVGSIIGVASGAGKLPEKWISPLHNKIKSGVDGFGLVNISDLAQRTLRCI